MNQDLSKSQQERLEYIAFRLQFVGSFSRDDIQRRFGVKGAAATRDISQFKSLYPNWMTYSAKARLYLRTQNCPVHIELSHSTIMMHMYADKLTELVQIGRAVPITELSQQHSPNLITLSSLSRAIYNHQVVTLQYLSLSSGKGIRDVVPLALVNSGVRWHLRAYDRKHGRFADFVLNRITQITVSNELSKQEESLLEDKQWSRFVTLELVPHPKLRFPEVIEFEYAMQSGVFQIDVRAALTGYFLRFWQVDCSPDHSLDAPGHYLWLKNQGGLIDIENLAIAPGYRSES